ncbi:MAG: hypothetical protein ACMUIE_06355 [Thermoplasmatota archaeon]
MDKSRKKSRGPRSLLDIDISDTIGDAPGLLGEERTRKKRGFIFPFQKKLPDINDVKSDVGDITKKLSDFDRADPREKDDFDIDQVMKDVDDIRNSLRLLENASLSERDRSLNRDMRAVNWDLDRMERKIGRIKKSKPRRVPPSRYLPPSDLETRGKKHMVLPALKPSEIGEGSADDKMLELGKAGRRRGGVDYQSDRRSETKVVRFKRSIPFLFLSLAFVLYIIISLRVVLDVPIARIFPVDIKPMTIFVILILLGLITYAVNLYRRQRIRNSLKKGEPVWKIEEVGRL